MKLHTDISKRCTNCGKEVWPALATAIIVAITRNNGHEILLVQSKSFKKNYLGLVAGFVETGETLEECVRRE
ncbi:NUDIX domain-containing protein, partial [Acinetobacter sp. 163]|nr:NUDIX domain-containing protein [Acinetobacter sp. 163]